MAEQRFYPSRPDLTGKEYHAEYNDFIAAEAAEIAAAEQSVVEPFTVLEPARELSVTEVGASIKAVHDAARALGWSTVISRSRTRHEDVLYVETTEEHNAGSIRTPAHDRRHYLLQAKHPSAMLGFRATWMGKDDPEATRDWELRGYTSRRWWPQGKPPVDPSIAKTASFVDAIVHDPIGFPVENYTDFTPTPLARKQQKEEPAVAYRARMADLDDTIRRRDYEYNDGSSRLEHEQLMRATTPFLAWVDDWLEQVAPDHKRLSRATKKTTTTQDKNPADGGLSSLLAAGEWSAE